MDICNKGEKEMINRCKRICEVLKRSVPRSPYDGVELGKIFKEFVLVWKKLVFLGEEYEEAYEILEEVSLMRIGVLVILTEGRKEIVEEMIRVFIEVSKKVRENVNDLMVEIINQIIEESEEISEEWMLIMMRGVEEEGKFSILVMDRIWERMGGILSIMMRKGMGKEEVRKVIEVVNWRWEEFRWVIEKMEGGVEEREGWTGIVGKMLRRRYDEEVFFRWGERRKDRSVNVRIVWVRSAIEYFEGEEEVRKMIEEKMVDPEEKVRVEVLRGLRKKGKEGMMKKIEERCFDRKESVRREAFEILIEVCEEKMEGEMIVLIFELIFVGEKEAGENYIEWVEESIKKIGRDKERYCLMMERMMGSERGEEVLRKWFRTKRKIVEWMEKGGEEVQGMRGYRWRKEEGLKEEKWRSVLGERVKSFYIEEEKVIWMSKEEIGREWLKIGVKEFPYIFDFCRNALDLREVKVLDLVIESYYYMMLGGRKSGVLVKEINDGMYGWIERGRIKKAVYIFIGMGKGKEMSELGVKMMEKDEEKGIEMISMIARWDPVSFCGIPQEIKVYIGQMLRESIERGEKSKVEAIIGFFVYRVSGSWWMERRGYMSRESQEKMVGRCFELIMGIEMRMEDRMKWILRMAGGSEEIWGSLIDFIVEIGMNYNTREIRKLVYDRICSGKNAMEYMSISRFLYSLSDEEIVIYEQKGWKKYLEIVSRYIEQVGVFVVDMCVILRLMTKTYPLYSSGWKTRYIRNAEESKKDENEIVSVLSTICLCETSRWEESSHVLFERYKNRLIEEKH